MPPRAAAGMRLASLPPSFLLPQFESLSIRAPGTSSTQIRTIRSIQKDIQKNARWNKDPSLPTLTSSQEAAFQRKLPTMPLRPGLLGYKHEMSAIYDQESGNRYPVTIIQLDRNQVVAHKTQDKHGYIAACIGCGAKAAGNVKRPQLGEFAARGVPIKRDQMEFRAADEKGLPSVGTHLGADWFSVGQYVDVRAKCRGKGFAGGMKRHGFHGQDRSHGASLSHRSMGSAGQGQGGGSRVLPGKKMAGRMGGQHVTVNSLKVVRVDSNNGLLVLAGAVPGPKRALVKLSDSWKKPWPAMPIAYAQSLASADGASAGAPSPVS